jgi:excisionase family DNA binding protein
MKKTVVENETSEARLYDPNAVARAFQWHPESVRRAIRQGRIHALRLGNGWRVPSDELARILRDGLPTAN